MYTNKKSDIKIAERLEVDNYVITQCKSNYHIRVFDKATKQMLFHAQNNIPRDEKGLLEVLGFYKTIKGVEN